MGCVLWFVPFLLFGDDFCNLSSKFLIIISSVLIDLYMAVQYCLDQTYHLQLEKCYHARIDLSCKEAADCQCVAEAD